MAVERNVFNEPLKNPERLQRSIAKGKQVSGWLRRGKRISGKDASALVNSLLFSLSGPALMTLKASSLTQVSVGHQKSGAISAMELPSLAWQLSRM